MLDTSMTMPLVRERVELVTTITFIIVLRILMADPKV